MQLKRKKIINVLFIDPKGTGCSAYLKAQEEAERTIGYSKYKIFADKSLDSPEANKLLDKADIVIISTNYLDNTKIDFKKFSINNNLSALCVLCKNSDDKKLTAKYEKKGACGFIDKQDVQNKNIIRCIERCLDRKQLENKILEVSNFNELTGLANSHFFKEKVKLLVKENFKSLDNFALLTFSINRFNNVAEKFGASAGDHLLKIIAKRIKEQKKLVYQAAYMGRHEFAIIVRDFSNLIVCQSRVEQIIDHITQPVQIDNDEITINVAAGVSLFPNTSKDPEQLIVNSEIALERASINTDTAIVFYKSKMRQANFEKRIIESSLQKAIKNKEFELYYQPQIDLKTNKVKGAESLIRWDSKELGSVSPADFIPVAEELGFINDIGNWVLDETCSAIANAKKAGLDIPISINVSARQFSQKRFVESVASAIKRSGIKIESLVLELTESTIMHDVISSAAALELLQSMGVVVHIDDFGTGYSSLSHLKFLPVNGLKIDKTFVGGVTENRGDAAITSAIINLAHKLDLKIVAEGAESQDHIKFLEKEGCDYVQGYFYSKPLPYAEFIKWAKTFNK